MLTKTRWAVLAITGALSATGIVVSSAASCAATPVIPPLRSFESAKNIDVVCMQVLTAASDGGSVGLPIAPPIPVDQQFCAPVPLNQYGAILPYHLFALVTQTARGEVAVIDLTAGQIIDEDPSTPLINFLPVGQNPAGIAAAPNGQMTFVTSADPNKPAIYGLASVKILGAAVNYDGGIVTPYNGAQARVPTLVSWPACSLPQTPGPIVAVPRGPLPPDAGAMPGPQSQGYVLAVVLPGDGRTQHARVLTIDPLPLLRGAGLDVGPGPTVPPGSLARCPIIGETVLSGTRSTPPGLGPAWDDGVKYAIEGGPEAGTPEAVNQGFVGAVGAVPLPQFLCGDAAVATTLPDAGDAGTRPPALSPGIAHATAAARADTYLYVADDVLPLIHVVDVSNPTGPREVAPLFATSVAEPTRAIAIDALAVSPFTRDYKRYLYAVDQTDNPASIIVYDITDPLTSPHVPLTRPHPELTPQLPLDRIQFTVPVAAVAFASHDFPLTQDPTSGQNLVGAAGSGLLCNPNPNANGRTYIDAATGLVLDASFKDPGAYYRNNFEVQQVQLGPARLRGIYGFATLTNGDVMLIDIDDWDSPCRRPVLMNGFTSDIAPPEQNTPGSGRFSGIGNPIDSYQAPEAGSTNGIFWVTNETFFPSTAPNRPRSQYAFDNDPLLGIHYPQVQVQPSLVDIVTGTVLPGGADAGDPALFPPYTTLADFTGYDGGAGVRLSWEDPLVHLNQPWTITYEGVLPSFSSNVEVNIELNPKDKTPYETLVISMPNGLICERGVEDLDVGRKRVAAAEVAATKLGLDTTGAPFPPGMNEWVDDYVQIAGSLPTQTDPYWSNPPDPECFGGVQDQDARYQQCYDFFQPIVDQYITRDFPILEAYDDHLVISRFAYPSDNPPPDSGADAAAYAVPPSTQNRVVVGPSPSNVFYLQQMRCCFSKQSTINVRTGGEWVAVGQTSGLLHHVTTDPTSTPPNRCVLACDSQQALLNSRSLGFFPTVDVSGTIPGQAVDRNSALAMRNPIFAYYITHPLGPAPNLSPSNPVDYPTSCPSEIPGKCVPQRVPRDLSWQFTTINAFSNQVVNLASTGTQLSPQSMLFIPSLGQLAVVDGAQEGLVLIDLGTIAVSGSPYF